MQCVIENYLISSIEFRAYAKQGKLLKRRLTKKPNAERIYVHLQLICVSKLVEFSRNMDFYDSHINN